MVVPQRQDHRVRRQRRAELDLDVFRVSTDSEKEEVVLEQRDFGVVGVSGGDPRVQAAKERR